MGKLLYFLVIATVIACSSAVKTTVPNLDKTVTKNDTVKIANDSLEYEVIIIDPGFNTWLASRAKPRNYYGLTMMEARNYWFISEYNRRVLDPYRYSPDLYEMRIDYDPNIHYGYEVNYLLYNYFLYFQQQYRQKL
jgi:hypothetical protein